MDKALADNLQFCTQVAYLHRRIRWLQERSLHYANDKFNIDKVQAPLLHLLDAIIIKNLNFIIMEVFSKELTKKKRGHMSGV